MKGSDAPPPAPAAGRLMMGIPGLDDILNGGLIPHRLYLVDGDPGAGKTTLSLQYLQEGVRRGEKCLYISLSETREELLAGAASHGWSLEGIEIMELASDETELDPDNQVTMFHPSEVQLSETTRRLLEAVERINPARVVFDSLSELRLLAQSSLRYRRQILALKQFLIGRKCTVLLLDDNTAEQGDLQIQSIAHGVIRLEQLSPLYGAARRRLRVLKLRGTDFRGGYHDFAIVRGGLVVFPRLVAAEHHTEFKPSAISSGIERLDALLGGGPHRGTSTLLMGPAGSGKSTIACQYATSAAARGVHAVIFAFDESLRTLTTRCASLGCRFEVGKGVGQVDLQQIDPAELSPGEFAARVCRAVDEDGARLVVIDSLNGYMNAMPEEQFLTAQLHELLTYLGQQGVTTFLVVAQHGLLGSTMQSPVDTSYLADSVVLLRYFEYAGMVKKAISVVKKRSGPHEETIREIWFDRQGIHLSEPLRRFRGILTGVPVELGSETSAAAVPPPGDSES
ncbi:MAG TPA: ATPase domain-containing protein [Phycisphaerae bacterium]|nr:ATPase domain-containing protein [Phycisphaerae bacterium]